LALEKWLFLLCGFCGSFGPLKEPVLSVSSLSVLSLGGHGPFGPAPGVLQVFGSVLSLKVLSVVLKASVFEVLSLVPLFPYRRRKGKVLSSVSGLGLFVEKKEELLFLVCKVSRCCE
jgi:hypothetical protein